MAGVLLANVDVCSVEFAAVVVVVASGEAGCSFVVALLAYVEVCSVVLAGVVAVRLGEGEVVLLTVTLVDVLGLLTAVASGAVATVFARLSGSVAPVPGAVLDELELLLVLSLGLCLASVDEGEAVVVEVTTASLAAGFDSMTVGCVLAVEVAVLVSVTVVLDDFVLRLQPPSARPAKSKVNKIEFFIGD